MSAGGPASAAPARYVSFDGAVQIRTRRLRPDRYRFFGERGFPDGPTIARGAGLSYVAASFGGDSTTIEHRRLNRVLGFDDDGCVVRVEAGATLGELYSFLEPRGYFLRVQPGHPNITIGGCVATDAHGKGHAAHGTFGRQVRRIALFHPRHGVVEAARDEASDLFELTCGAYGLTGNVIWVELAIEKTPAALETHVLRLAALGELESALEAAEREWEWVYSWHDLLVDRDPWGPGHLIVARRASRADRAANGPAPDSSLDSRLRARLPVGAFSRSTARLVNRVHGSRLAAASDAPFAAQSLFSFQFPVRGLESYFLLFGRPGFFEHQILVPPGRFGEWSDALRARLRTHPFPITLASGKLFRGDSRFLRFTGNGVCFALNGPRRRGADTLLRFLDELAVSVGARVNPIKDSRVPQAVVAATSPGYDDFRRRLAEFDPQRTYRSELSERLAL